MTDYEKSDINRLLSAFRHEEPDRIPHLEFWVTSKPVFENICYWEENWSMTSSTPRSADSESHRRIMLILPPA